MPRLQLQSSFTLLPIEIVGCIFSLLPKEMLLYLRLVNRHCESVATPFAFRSLRLETYDESPIRFIHIAKSEKLRALVQELTCDTCVPGWGYRMSDDYPFPCEFMLALPYLRYLSHLKALHLRFNEDCGFSGVSEDDEESSGFRFRVLEPVFKCLAGIWSVDEQKEYDREWVSELEYSEDECQYHRLTTVGSISLTTLTVSNLAGYNMHDLTESEAFKFVMASPTLVDLKIYVAVETEGMDRDYEFSALAMEFYENLSSTWLSPPVAANLRELSLYGHQNWGWCPKLDFRNIGAGNGLPNLKVLALGKFVFSHEWQIDWMVSLGLEELYLDDCAVLSQIEIRGTLDDTSQIVGQDASGQDIWISNTGYLPKDWRRATWGETNNFNMTRLPLRWHAIFKRWRESMTTLRVVKVGSGAWKGSPEETILANYSLVHDSPDEPRRPSSHRFEHNAFRYFSCPPPGGSGDGYRHGTGMRDSPNLRYVYFNICFWSEWEIYKHKMMKMDDPDWILEHDLDVKDQEELNLFVRKIQTQQSQSSVNK